MYKNLLKYSLSGQFRIWSRRRYTQNTMKIQWVTSLFLAAIISHANFCSGYTNRHEDNIINNCGQKLTRDELKDLVQFTKGAMEREGMIDYAQLENIYSKIRDRNKKKVVKEAIDSIENEDIQPTLAEEFDQLSKKELLLGTDDDSKKIPTRRAELDELLQNDEEAEVEDDESAMEQMIYQNSYSHPNKLSRNYNTEEEYDEDTYDTRRKSKKNQKNILRHLDEDEGDAKKNSILEKVKHKLSSPFKALRQKLADRKKHKKDKPAVGSTSYLKKMKDYIMGHKSE